MSQPTESKAAAAKPDRRTFLKRTAESAAVAGTLAFANVARAGANERLVVALIGPGGMGSGHLNLLGQNKAVDLAWVCDVDELRLGKAADTAEKLSGKRPQTTKDMRQVFDDKTVDAVWIATPDHWHGPATILACDAGKHVYVEKPCSHNIREGRLMIEAARRNNRVVQVGTQTRSTKAVREAIDKLRGGVIGDVLVAKAWNSQRRSSIGHVQPSDPPSTLDYDLWTGPAPLVPYQSNLLPSIWRWWYNFGAGDMGNDGVHDIDVALWGLGAQTHPTSVVALGGKYFFDDDQQFPDTQYVAFEWAGDGKPGHKRQLVFEQRIWSPYVQENWENGDAWYGTEGIMVLGKKGGYKIFGPRNKLIEEATFDGPDLAAHHANFMECIKTGARPNADIEINHLSTTLCHLGNIATRTRAALEFDPATERITNNSDAAALVRRQYREGHWAVPRGV
jgi:predicted dehydrogenase